MKNLDPTTGKVAMPEFWYNKHLVERDFELEDKVSEDEVFSEAET